MQPVSPQAPGADPGPVRLAYRLDGAAVEARVTRGLAPAARALFPDARAEPSPGADAELVLEGRPEGGFTVRGPGRESREPDAPSALVAYELALAETLARRTPGVPLHAAGARFPAGAVALVGAGGHGKSTLAAALAQAGWPVYGDDVLLLDERAGRARAFRRLIKLVGPTPELLGLPRPAGPLADLWPDSALYHPTALGSGWAAPAPVGAVWLLAREEGRAGAEVEPLAPAAAMTRLLPQLQLVTGASAREFEALAAALDGAETGVLRYGDARDAVALLETRFAEGRDRRSWDQGPR